MLKFFDDSNFRQDLALANPIYVFFFSPSCGPCSTIYPQVENFGKTTNNILYMVHEEEGKELQQQLNVTAYPSMVVVKNRKILKAGLGAEEVTNIIEDGTSNQ